MSTSSTAARCPRNRSNDAGVTVVELLLAVGIMGLLAVLVSVPLTMTNRLSKTALEKATETMDSNLALRSMAKQLTSSQITRAGVIQCTGDSAILTTTSTAKPVKFPKEDAKPGEKPSFTIPFSAGSSIGAIGATPNEIHVTDAIHFIPGDLVTVVSSEKSEDIGIFTVNSVKDDDNKPTLVVEAANLADFNSDCKVLTGKLKTMPQLASAVSGTEKGSVFVQALQFAIYELDGRTLRMQAYPRSKTFNYIAFENLVNLTIQASWYDSAGKTNSNDQLVDGKVNSETNGTYLARIDVVLEESSLAVEHDEKGNLKPSKILRSYSTSGRYVMSSTKKMNDKAITNARPPKETYPTCAVVISEDITAADYKRTKLPHRQNMVRVSAVVSDGNTPFIGLSFNSLKGPLRVDCSRKGDGRTFANTGFELRKKSSPDDLLNQAVCGVDGAVEVTGTFNYYDKGLKRNQQGQCKATIGVAASKEKFKPDPDDKPSCAKPNTCHPGSLIGDKGTRRTLSLATVENGNDPQVICKWSDGNKTRPCCSNDIAGLPGTTVLEAVTFIYPGEFTNTEQAKNNPSVKEANRAELVTCK